MKKIEKYRLFGSDGSRNLFIAEIKTGETELLDKLYKVVRQYYAKRPLPMVSLSRTKVETKPCKNDEFLKFETDYK